MHQLMNHTTAFMPHGHCWAWTPGIFWLMVIGNALVALAYYSIPLVLFRLLRGRRDLPYPHLFVLFGLFILFCGTGHIIDIVTIWQPLYWLDAFWDFGTGVISIATAIVLWPLLPKLMKAGTIEEVLQRETIDKLEQQNRDLDEANARMNQANQSLHGQMEAMREATRVLAEREARIRELRDELDAYKAKYGPNAHG